MSSEGEEVSSSQGCRFPQSEENCFQSFPTGPKQTLSPPPGRPRLQLGAAATLATLLLALPSLVSLGPFYLALLYWEGGSRDQEAPGQPAPALAKQQGGFSTWEAKPRRWVPFLC